jgi:exopolyphosphatase/guanosine-5'-triphosphate,3'-diphosphate pyrophosphatase
VSPAEGRSEWEGALLRLGRKYGFDEAHGRQVARLADDLADRLSPLHRLDEEFRGALRGAALVHDIGQAVASRGHHRHTAYLIQCDDALDGRPEGARLLVALLARSHRKKLPDLPGGWSRQRRQRFLQAAALLRVADGLDGSHDGRASLRACRIGPDSVALVVAGLDPTAQDRVVKHKAGLFARVFEREVRLAASHMAVSAAGGARGAGA